MLAIVSLSGGMDSATVLAEALAAPQTTRVVAASFVYGSKHNAYERACAEALARHYDVELVRIDFSEPFRQFSSNLLKSGGPIPEGHYEAPTMAQTVVPARNTGFIVARGVSVPFLPTCQSTFSSTVTPCSAGYLYAMAQRGALLVLPASRWSWSGSTFTTAPSVA